MFDESKRNAFCTRKMLNGDWVIPFSVAIVMKKVKVFDPIKCEMEAAMTMIQRYKLTGLPEDIRGEVEEFILDSEKFKCRVNEEEYPLVYDGDYNRSGKFTINKSEDHEKDQKPDLLQFTLRCR
jgi:hypothetical protein